MNSLRARLMVPLICGIMVMAIAGTAVLYPFLESRIVAEFDDALFAKARALTSFADSTRHGVNLQFTEAGLLEFSIEKSWEFYQVMLDGEELARSPSLANETLLPDKNELQLPGSWNAKLVNGSRLRVVAFQVGQGKEAMVVLFAKNRAQLDHTLRSIVAMLVFAVGVACVFALLLANYVVNSSLRSIKQIAGQISGASFDSAIAEKNAPVELQPVIASLNRLLTRLRKVYERERRLSSDIAHELTTPVGELRSLSDVTLKWGEDPESKTRFIEKVQGISIQLEHTLKILLSLARSESGRERVKLETVLLDQQMEELLNSLQARITKKNLVLERRLQTFVVQTDANLSRTMLFNVLDNAVAYCSEGGRLLCQVDAQRRQICIKNSQDGLTAQDLEQMDEPFWRKDEARSDGTHSGLGLALTKAYAIVLGVDVKRALHGNGDFETVMVFPDLPAGAHKQLVN